MTTRLRWVFVGAALLTAGGLIGHWVGSAGAAGVPTQQPVLAYSGYLETAGGAPASGTHAFVLSIWTSSGADGGTGTPACQVVPTGRIDVTNGNFQIPISDAACVAAIHANTDTWIEIQVDGESLGRSKNTAVPYALEADRATDVTGTIHPGGIDLSARVRKTPARTGTSFVADAVAGANMCTQAGFTGFHPCQAWEAMVLDTLSTTTVFDVNGWVVGDFPNSDEHMRSLVNGQNSTVCPVGFHLMKYYSKFVTVGITTPGGLHCVADATSMPVWCCQDKT